MIELDIILLALCPIAALLLVIFVDRVLKRPREDRVNVGYRLLLRTIHANWILLPPAFLFTFLFSPYIFFKFYRSELIIAILTSIIAIISIYVGYRMGEKLIVEVYLKYKTEKYLVLSSITSTILFFIIIAMDVQSVTEEGSLSWVHSAIFLFIATIILTLPLIKET
jgi:hypothetical protein